MYLAEIVPEFLQLNRTVIVSVRPKQRHKFSKYAYAGTAFRSLRNSATNQSHEALRRQDPVNH